MGLIKSIHGSINLKVMLITLTGVLTAAVVWAAFGIISFQRLRSGTLNIVNREMEGLVYEYYGNHIDQVAANINQYIDGMIGELHILSGITQTWFDNGDDLQSLSEEMNRYRLFRDNLRKGDDWVDNDPSEPTELFIPRYLLGDGLTVGDNISPLIDETRFLDLVMPRFYDSGNNKVQVYFQGGKNREIFRMAPWSGIGKNIYSVYPELNEMPVWETFNPGLADQWQKLIAGTGGDREK